MLFSSRKREADAVSQELVSARIGVENTSNELAKTLEEMLSANDRANLGPRKGENDARLGSGKHFN